MFSGIVHEIGLVTEQINYGSDIAITILTAQLSKELKTGDSVAVNGCCVTVTKIEGGEFSFNIVTETINKTNLSQLNIGSQVNLERSIIASQLIGGHFVQGHVAVTAKVVAVEEIGDSKLVSFYYPANLAPYIVNKGYVALDGMSITVIEVTQDKFSVMFVPYTLRHTIANSYAIGTKVNLEVDIIGRYIEKLVNYHANKENIYE